MYNDWPHAPSHRLESDGAYMITAGTYHKHHILNTPEKLTRFCRLLFRLCDKHKWHLQAWAVMSNHYHFIALAPHGEHHDLGKLITELHRKSAIGLNQLDNKPERKVWFQFWDSHLTFEKSYYARLNYVHNNPVHHGATNNASDYDWCSLSWLINNTSPAFYKSILNFKIDKVNVRDDF